MNTKIMSLVLGLAVWSVSSCKKSEPNATSVPVPTKNAATASAHDEVRHDSFKELVIGLRDGSITPNHDREFLGAIGFPAHADGDDPFLYHSTVVESDQFAYTALCARFSDPVAVCTFDNQGGIKTLQRYWKVPGGFLSLTGGRDVRDCFVSIKFQEAGPRRADQFTHQSEEMTISEEFLRSFEAKLVPFSKSQESRTRHRTGHKLFKFISISLQPRRWAHI